MHLTLNTLVRQDELHAALKVAEEACVLGVDALIVQDVGLARRIRAAAPGMALHASTQLSCHTPSGVRFLRDSGFSRVVLAREMSRDEIAACAGQGCELEVFVHGRCACACRGNAICPPCWAGGAATGDSAPSPVGCPSPRRTAGGAPGGRGGPQPKGSVPAGIRRGSGGAGCGLAENRGAAPSGRNTWRRQSRYTGRRCGGKRRPRGFQKIYRQYFPAPVLLMGITLISAAAGCSAPGGGRTCRPLPRCCPGWNGCTTRRRAGCR